jgi:hypothetical protein
MDTERFTDLTEHLVEPASPDPVVDDDMEAPVSAPPAVRLDRVAIRAQRMLGLLEANGFVSFG